MISRLQRGPDALEPTFALSLPVAAALALRGIPLSITAGVRFIPMSAVAVLTGVIVVTAFRDLLNGGRGLEAAIREGAHFGCGRC